tara:strand:- start:8916 stop:9470 length:555 start_codon:yes stop_codon:yes gene_type:complete
VKLINKHRILISFSIILLIIFFLKKSFISTTEYKGKQIHEGGFYLGKILLTPNENFEKTQIKEFKELKKFISTNKLFVNGSSFIIYTSRSKTNTQYIIAVPVKQCSDILLPSKFVCNYYPKLDVLSVVHKGYLSKRYKGWEILDQYLKLKKKILINAPFEVFWKGIEQTKDSTKWITGLYYPIK